MRWQSSLTDIKMDLFLLKEQLPQWKNQQSVSTDKEDPEVQGRPGRLNMVSQLRCGITYFLWSGWQGMEPVGRGERGGGDLSWLVPLFSPVSVPDTRRL